MKADIDSLLQNPPWKFCCQTQGTVPYPGFQLPLLGTGRVKSSMLSKDTFFFVFQASKFKVQKGYEKQECILSLLTFSNKNSASRDRRVGKPLHGCIAMVRRLQVKQTPYN